MEFEEFPKIARLSRQCVVTEKIDGTNAQIHIVRADSIEDGLSAVGPLSRLAISVKSDEELVMLAGSRTQYITPERDNHGFARWVADHDRELFALGEGRHYGEWWGSGIQRGYGLQKGEKRFSLFNVARWADARDPMGRGLLPDDKQTVAPACCSVVPILYRGDFDTSLIEAMAQTLREKGSRCAPGFRNPEGIVVWHEAARLMFKMTLERDSEPKSKHALAT